MRAARPPVRCATPRLRTPESAHVPGLQLRCQVDLRHQEQRLRMRVGFEPTFDRRQVDLGLAAAGHAEQQRRHEPASAVSCSTQAACSEFSATRAPLGVPSRASVLAACAGDSACSHSAAQAAGAAPAARLAARPRPRDAGSNRGKTREREPVRIQRLDVCEQLRDGLDARLVQSAVLSRTDDQADEFPSTQSTTQRRPMTPAASDSASAPPS